MELIDSENYKLPFYENKIYAKIFQFNKSMDLNYIRIVYPGLLHFYRVQWSIWNHTFLNKLNESKKKNSKLFG